MNFIFKKEGTKVYSLMVECRPFNPGVLGSNPNTLKI